MSKPKLHVVFGPSAAGALRQALIGTGRADQVLCPYDDFSFGPIASDDAAARVAWVEHELSCSGWEDVVNRTTPVLATSSLKSSLVAWVSQSDTCSYAGFLWWLSHIGNTSVSIVSVAELGRLLPHQMVKLFDLEVPLAAEDRAHHRARWEQLKAENAPLRVIGGDGLISAPIDHFDPTLLSFATPHWQKMAMIVGKTLVAFDETGIRQTGDMVLHARLVALAEAGALEWQGDLAQMRGCELRLPVARRC